MRNIRTKRVRTQGIAFFSHPFQESVLEVELQKHHKCLLQIQKNNFSNATLLLQQIVADKSLIKLSQSDKNMLNILTICTKTYLLHRQCTYHQALKCLEEIKQFKNRHQSLHKMKISLTQLIKSVIFCQLGKFDQSKQAIKYAFQIIKTQKDSEFLQTHLKKYQKYNQVFIIFFDMIVLDLTKLIKFSQILNIYKEGQMLAGKILGKNHKLTLLMNRIILQNVRTNSTQLKYNQMFDYKSFSIKMLNSKRKLKINQQKMSFLSTKQKQMKRIYSDNDKIILNKLTSSNRLTKNQEKIYLRSLQKVKNIYSKNKQRANTITDSIEVSQEQSSIFSKGRTFIQADFSRKHIKEIILKGRRLNKNMLYLNESQISYTQGNLQTISQPLNYNTINTLQQTQQMKEKEKKESNKAKSEIPKQLTFTNIVAKVEEARQTRQSECQLI